jgi:tetratricopeptide (TPR) repeat protein
MWIEVFDGPHQWPSAALMSGAIDFMQAAAMRDKLIPADAAFLGAFVKGRLARAESYAEDNPLRAAQQFRQIARTFEGVEGAASASGRAETLENSPEVRRILARQAEIESRAAALSSTNEAAAAEALDWLKKAAEPKDAAGGEARRALLGASLRMQLRGVDALRNKRYEDAARWLERAFRAVPMDATAAYNAACAYSLLGRKADALKLLGEAVTAGFRDAGHIAADADLDPIRGEPGYRDIIKELGRDPGKDAGKD